MEHQKIVARAVRMIAPATASLCLALSVTALAAFPAPGQAQVRISEVLCAPTEDYDLDGEVDSKSDEFVEVHNASSEPFALEGLYLRDGTGDAYHYGFAGSLPAGGTLVVTGTMAQVWQAENDGGTSGLSLNNTGEVVELWYEAPGGDEGPVLMDVLTVPPHCASVGRSMVLDLASGQYVLHDALSPYGGTAIPLGSGCPPSPAVPGTCDLGVPGEVQAWGAVKARFGD